MAQIYRVCMMLVCDNCCRPVWISVKLSTPAKHPASSSVSAQTTFGSNLLRYQKCHAHTIDALRCPHTVSIALVSYKFSSPVAHHSQDAAFASIDRTPTASSPAFGCLLQAERRDFGTGSGSDAAQQLTNMFSTCKVAHQLPCTWYGIFYEQISRAKFGDLRKWFAYTPKAIEVGDGCCNQN
jgi:hypothetical protein